MRKIGYINSVLVLIAGKSEMRYRVIYSNGCFACECHSFKTAKKILNAFEIKSKYEHTL